MPVHSPSAAKLEAPTPKGRGDWPIPLLNNSLEPSQLGRSDHRRAADRFRRPLDLLQLIANWLSDLTVKMRIELEQRTMRHESSDHTCCAEWTLDKLGSWPLSLRGL